ncbi:hypothetical protein PDQ75_24925 [Bacillus cereus group sp. Bc015]|uniref:hypothetical protein n=1 Tax=Bacillus cereus group sp. Bc015 TaxID=3018123 RepID=UPI0022E76928|nr:hypothetical protein [Bacillus cereus group sp. Bc015]MDA2738400.1 hypothetical protein [Bacillus cereus group sp. Bc015]
MTIEKLVFEVKGLQVVNEKAFSVQQMELVIIKKEELLTIINSAFETGFWIGNTYDLLHSLKADLYNIEKSIDEKVMALLNA